MTKKVDKKVVEVVEAPSEGRGLAWLAKKIEEVQARQYPPGVSQLGEPTITKWFKDVTMSQIYSTGLEYAFISQTGEQCHAFAFCKDFLQDAVWATLNKASSSIYGFSYTHGTNPPVDMHFMRLAVRCKGVKGKDLESACEKSLKFLQEVEAIQGFSPSELQLGGVRKGEKNRTFVFVSDKAWLHSSVMISLYSLLVRVGMTYEGGGWRKHFDDAKEYFGKNDSNYTNTAKKGVDKLIGKDPTKLFAKDIKDNYPSSVDVSSLHNHSGILAYAKGTVSNKVSVNWSKKGK